MHPLGSKTVRNIPCLDVTQEGAYLSGDNSLFLMELDGKQGAFPNYQSLRPLISNQTAMTWHSGDAHLAATTGGMIRIQDPLKTEAKNPIRFGLTTSNQHHFVLQQTDE